MILNIAGLSSGAEVNAVRASPDDRPGNASHLRRHGICEVAPRYRGSRERYNRLSPPTAVTGTFRRVD